MKRWAEKFDGVLNRSPSISDKAINRLPQMECNPLLDEFTTVSEKVKEIKLSYGKASELDAILTEVYKTGSPQVAEKHYVRRKQSIPQEFRDAIIIHLFKRKGNHHICDNHRGISLLLTAGKVLARDLLNRLNDRLEQSGLLPEGQYGFRKDRRIIDIIFTADSFKTNVRNRMSISS